VKVVILVNVLNVAKKFKGCNFCLNKRLQYSSVFNVCDRVRFVFAKEAPT